MSTINKEERNNYVIHLPHWLWRFVPHIFFTPQHILEKPGRKDRQIRAPLERVLCTLIVPSLALATILYLYILRRTISKNHRSVRIFVPVNGVPKGP